MKTSDEIIKISGKLIDIHQREIYPAIINIENGRIHSIERSVTSHDVFIMPGLIDAHIHIESSMITPGAFALTAVKHGTCGVVSDPHEIGNVLGVEGVKYMIRDSRLVPLKFYFGAPSCVPATVFETSGAEINHTDIRKLLSLPEIKYLSEMMNYPGVINNDREVLLKLKAAREFNKPVDGHAPGLRGAALEKYVTAGISTDHECSTLDEALEKIGLGMKILIREGSAARNMDALKDLFRTHPDDIMLCSDDLHPEMLQSGHINKLIAKLVSEGYDLFDVIRSATINPVKHYKLNNGLLRPGDPADLILVDDPVRMNVRETLIDGTQVFSGGRVHFKYSSGSEVNKFNCSKTGKDQIRIKNAGGKIRVIKAVEGELLTGELLMDAPENEFIDSNIRNDILKIVVKNRYNDAAPVTGLIQGFNLKKGAFASSVAHDSHNIIAIGTNDDDLISAINEIVRLRGGLAVATGGEISSLQLNIGGIISASSCENVAADYQKLSGLVRNNGCLMKAPFMTLSFMALLVIPDLKIGDRGLFDVKKFSLVPLFEP